MKDSALLLAGPRGRRLLLEYALESQRMAFPHDEEWRLHRAVGDAAYNLDPGKGTSTIRILFGDNENDETSATPEFAASLLSKVPLAEPTPDLLRHSLHQSVMAAMYWQPPDGPDILAATPVMQDALHRVTEHIARSPHIDWWDSAWDVREQSWIWWGDYRPSLDEVMSQLAQWRNQPSKPHVNDPDETNREPIGNSTGIWWSVPPIALPHTSRNLEDGTPAGLWFSEDVGYQRAMSSRVHLPPDPKVLKIGIADDWANLCRQYPLDVTHEKRNDWYHTTGRIGTWIMPDWHAVAQEFDGVHLSVAAYLAAAGTAIPVDEDTASVIAGWNPDDTWWFTEPISLDQGVLWEYAYEGDANVWRIVES